MSPWPAAADPATAARPLPRDVASYAARRDDCDHFRGEEAYDKERAALIARMLDKTCKGADKELARLRRVHKADPAAIAALSGYEDRIE